MRLICPDTGPHTQTIAPSHRARSPYRSGERVTMCEHHSLTSPEDPSSDCETSSDTTLLEGHQEPEASHTACADWAIDASASYSDDSRSSAFFPLHLVSGCSCASRLMCQYSRSITSQEVKRVLGLRGTSRRVRRCIGSRPAPQPAAR